METTNENTINTSSSQSNSTQPKFNWEKARKEIVNLEDTLKRSLRSQSGKYAIFRFFAYDCMWEGEGYYVNDVYSTSYKIVLPVEALFLPDNKFQAVVRKAMSTQVQRTGHVLADKQRIRRIHVDEQYSMVDSIELYVFKDRQVCPYGRFDLIVEDSDNVE